MGAGAAFVIGFAAAPQARHDVPAGDQLFRVCASCHSLEPGRHMTGPSLAGLFGRRAGTADGFDRYSEPLKASGIVWDEESLDTWLTDPQGMVPGTLMGFVGIEDPAARAALIAFLEEAV